MRTYQSFFDALSEQNLEPVLRNDQFTMKLPMKAAVFCEQLNEAIQKNLKIKIEPDCDADGFFAALAIKTGLDKIGYRNYVVAKPSDKHHSLSITYLTSIVEQQFGMVIIVDSSTNDMEGLTFLSDHGIKVLVADHHKTNYTFPDYPENVTIVNPKIDMKYKPTECSELSGCAVSAILMLYFLQKYHKAECDSLYMYAYITLYSDSCDMGNKYNRWIAYRCLNKSSIPYICQPFFDTKWDHMNRNFISWKFIPRINALIRSEKFDYAWNLFYNPGVYSMPGDKLRVRAEVDEIYKIQRRNIEDVYTACLIAALPADSLDEEQQSLIKRFPGIQTFQYTNFVVSILPYSMAREFRSYTGPIAQRLGSEFNCAGICLVTVDSVSLDGSVRDTHSRDLQSVFQTACYAEGHGPAFGISLPANQLHAILRLIDEQKLSFHISTASRLVVDWDSYNKANRKLSNVIDGESFYQCKQDTAADNFNQIKLYDEARAMAIFNEFSGGSLPKACCVMTIMPSCPNPQNGANRSSVVVATRDRNKVTIVSYQHGLAYGYRCLMTPTLRGDNVELVVDTVLQTCLDN